MNDDDDRTVRSAFEDLRRSVESAVDAEAARGRFEQIRTASGRRRVKAGRAIGAAAAAAAVLVLVGLVTMWPSGNGTREVVTGGTVEPTTSEVSHPTCPDPNQLFVYLDPDVDPPETYDVSAYLGNLEGVESVGYMDEEDTYAEFTQLFADEPELVDSVKPGDLPRSFRPVRSIPWDEATLNGLEALPGVKEVQTAAEHVTPECVDASPEGGASGRAATGANSDEVPGRGVVDQPLGPMVPAPPFQVPANQKRAAGFGTNSAPVAHATDLSLTGYVDWDDMYPATRPVDDTFPPPMVPVWNEDRTQIGWWAANLGWVTFEDVSDPDFDFRERWLAERTNQDAARELHGANPPDTDDGQ